MAQSSIKEVARIAGVSTATVSRCLNSPEQVKEPTKTRVQEAILETGNSPNTWRQDYEQI